LLLAGKKMAKVRRRKRKTKKEKEDKSLE